jgi:cell division protein FtsQ
LSEPLPLPVDVRLMNITATLLFAGFAALALAALAGWVLRQPVFALRGIQVQGDVAHSNALTLRANVAPKLSGTFFTVDLNKTRQAFEAVPWVRRAEVRRDFPNRLKVRLQEHQVAGYWGPESESRLVNTYGEVFEANVDEVDQDSLPRFIGPDGQGAAVLAMFQALKPLFDDVDLALDQLELTGRGSWRVKLDNGAEVELGRGPAEELLPRVQRFLRTLTQVASKYGRTVQALESADLRYAQGYALRLRGVVTLTQAQPKP